MSYPRHQAYQWVYIKSLNANDYVVAGINDAIRYTEQLIKDMDGLYLSQDNVHAIHIMRENCIHLREQLTRPFANGLYTVRYIEVPKCFEVTDIELKATLNYYNAPYLYTLGWLRGMQNRIARELISNIHTPQTKDFFEKQIKTIVDDSSRRHCDVKPVFTIPLPVEKSGIPKLIEDIQATHTLKLRPRPIVTRTGRSRTTSMSCRERASANKDNAERNTEANESK